MYGNKIGQSKYAACEAVIGSVSRSMSGNTVLETGVRSGDGWEKIGTEIGRRDAPVGCGHVVITPEERRELIAELTSHEEAEQTRHFRTGDTIPGPLGAVVMAVSYHNGHADEGKEAGVLLAYSAHKREYWVWSVGPRGDLASGTYSYDLGAAMTRYSVRVTEHLHTHFNHMSPAPTFGHVADRDKLKG